MNCRKVNSLLSAYLDGELSGSEQLQVRQHLRRCGHCEDEHESLQQTKQILARLSTRSPDPALEQRILQRIAEESGRTLSRYDPRGWWGLLGEPDRAALRSVSMLVIVALAALMYSLQPFRTSPPRPDEIAGQSPNLYRAEIESKVPIQDMLGIHHVGGSAQPVSTGMVPVTGISDLSAP